MLKKVLPIFSYFFHPLFIPLLAIVFYFLVSTNSLTASEQLLVYTQGIIFTIILPVLCFLFLKSINKIDSIMLPIVSQRKIPLLIQSILFLVLITQGNMFVYIPGLYYFFLGCFISTLLALLLVLIDVKASLHMVGVSSLVSFCIAMSVYTQRNLLLEISILFFLNGLVGTSRLYMKAHTPKELLAGFFVGFIPQLFLIPWIFLQNIK
ncbi:hypothetical protein [Flavobacterium ardleyense]|uniref:hypothetical protein n=1 Tax=Flavobacterium ardleyense TaxID=2038737 RepID=UPI00298D25B1|nr:hypothetical protein [Flavobacterium ardleyense]